MKTIIKITKQEAIDAWKSMNNYQNDKEIIIEIEENHLHYTEDLVFPKLKPLTVTSTSGEWCQACGAWRQYGQQDNHYCTGYKVTC